MIVFNEPQLGVNIVQSLNDMMHSSDILGQIIPITADVFVFLFPILLIILYLVGLIKKEKSFKESALRVFRCAILSTAVNIFFQTFFDKHRPISVLGGQENFETILHKYLPSSSFPSDHAAMSIGFAMGLLLRGLKYKNKKYIRIGILFIIFSLIMGFSRIMVGAHRPTDILGGFVIGLLVPLLLNSAKIFRFIKKYLIDAIICFQEWIWKLFGAK